MKSTTKKIRPYAFSDKELSLTITDSTKLNKTKQRNALMPNLVHSLDSTSLILLFYSLKKCKNDGFINFYSVHDCYGVTAENVELLIEHIRQVYIDLYSEAKYINSFDKDVIDLIRKTLGGDSNTEYSEDRRVILVKNSNMKITLPPKPGNKHLGIEVIQSFYKRLAKSSLLIN